MKIDIGHVAKLASLKLTPDEEEIFDKQLSQILDYFSQLKEVETEKVEPIGHITGLENVVRDDETMPSISQEDAIGQAPKTHNGFIEVEAILENQDNLK